MKGIYLSILESLKSAINRNSKELLKLAMWVYGGLAAYIFSTLYPKGAEYVYPLIIEIIDSESRHIPLFFLSVFILLTAVAMQFFEIADVARKKLSTGSDIWL